MKNTSILMSRDPLIAQYLLYAHGKKTHSNNWVLINSDLTFNNHLNMICKYASQKLTSISQFIHNLSESNRYY